MKKKQKLEKEINDTQEENDEEKEKDKVEEDETLIVPFSACLNTFFSEEVIQYRNPSLGPNVSGPAMRTTKIGTD